jgi:hypothetical protein
MRSAPGRCGRVAWLLAAGWAIGSLFGLFSPAPAQKRERTVAPTERQTERQPERQIDHPIAQGNEPGKDAGKKVRSYTFGGLDIDGRLKTPQLLYFLNRMKSEFDTTVPEKRSFLPELRCSPEEM